MNSNETRKGFTLIELLIAVAIIGIVAAIAIPSLLQARISANESATVGDIRTVISAQAAYQASNAGLYDSRLSCLADPDNGCIPSYPVNAPTFLDSAIAALQARSGYSRTFLGAGVPVPRPANASPSSVTGYVYLASPIDLGHTGVRGFGGDATGVLCFDPKGTAPTFAAATALLDTNAADCIVLN